MQPLPRSDWALFLDIDGTLIEHADHPEGIVVPKDLPDCLAAVQAALDGAVALISGRTIEWMDRKFAPVRLAASGQHGAEVRLTPDAPAVPIPMPAWRAPLEAALQRDLEAWPGVFIEHKPLSLAVHFRAVPELGDEVMERVMALGRSHGDNVQFLHGRFVIEVREAGHHKGTAVQTLMKTPIFAGRTPVFLGDDVTDEDGFEAVHAMGGIAVAIGPRPTQQADFRISTPTRVRSWLAALPALLVKEAS